MFKEDALSKAGFPNPEQRFLYLYPTYNLKQPIIRNEKSLTQLLTVYSLYNKCSEGNQRPGRRNSAHTIAVATATFNDSEEGFPSG